MKANIRKWTIIAFAMVLVVCATMIIAQQIQYKEADEAYALAAEMAGVPDLSDPEVLAKVQAETEAETIRANAQAGPRAVGLSAYSGQSLKSDTVQVDVYAKALSGMSFEALLETNEDVIGWIVVPDTNISYPLLKAADNSYYVEHNWMNAGSAAGAVFLDYRNDPSLVNFNSNIYGHRMNNGSMFAQLHAYKYEAFYVNHPTFYINTASGCLTYKVFAAYTVDVTKDITYDMTFANDAEKQAYIDFCLAKSEYDTGVIPGVDSNIVTLSTCTHSGGNTRWVVQGVLD